MPPSISVRDVGLRYRLSRNRTVSLKNFAISALKRQLEFDDLWALRGVSFEVSPGEVIGVIGRNGAGKSTLMKVLARVLPPTEGRVIVRGRTAPMIELGAGFNPELTGYENAVLYGAILGRDPVEMRDRVDAIARWAEIEDYLTVPIRNYSSGMVARLAFSVAVDVEPDVLIIDEVLSVGDESFQKRSRSRIDDLIAGGAAVVLVTHNLDHVVTQAQRAIWLERGNVAGHGDPREVVDRYRRFLAGEDTADEPPS